MRHDLKTIVAALHVLTEVPPGSLQVSVAAPIGSGAWRVAGRLERMGMSVERVGTDQPRAKEAGMRTFRVTVEGRAYEVTVEEVGAAVPPSPAAPPRRSQAVPPKAAARPVGERRILAPMPGKILAVNVAPGDAVESDGVVLVLEAMKMENDILAGADGTITTVEVTTGDRVNTGDLLAVIE
jgi:glutaconyl-CoA decarboxylase